jgi:hypothetical protein
MDDHRSSSNCIYLDVPYLPHQLALYVIQKIMSEFVLLNIMLALLVFFLCGSRTTEFLDPEYTNPNRPCCVFLDDQGTVWVVVRRVKFEGITRPEFFLPKKCPPVLFDLLKRYLFIIHPVEKKLACLVFGKGSDMAKAAASNYSTFL